MAHLSQNHEFARTLRRTDESLTKVWFRKAIARTLMTGMSANQPSTARVSYARCPPITVVDTQSTTPPTLHPPSTPAAGCGLFRLPLPVCAHPFAGGTHGFPHPGANVLE